MKKLTVILFDDPNDAFLICEKYSGLSEKREFLGTWWIGFNEEEAYAAISGAANHFIENSDKTEIIFGISSKDYEDVISKINAEKCVVETVNCKKL